MDRLKPKPQPKAPDGGLYFKPPSSIGFVSSGCTLFDLMLGGKGWPLGRMSNLIGDKSTGKTLLAIEACANFAATYMGPIWYRETEAAFDPDYAAALGLPLNRVSFLKKGHRLNTIEQMYDDLVECCKEAKKQKAPGLYIVDSFDALSSDAELRRKITDDGYKLEKQKMLGELFRRMVREVEDTQVALIIVSQVRTKIGVMFGDKTTRSGGAALDFYATLAIKLSHMKNLVATVNGIKRVTGIRVKAKCIKNKIGLPQRECEFIIRFGFGVEDFQAGIEWLIEHKRVDMLGLSKAKAEVLLDESLDWNTEEYGKRRRALTQVLGEAWADVEKDFAPARTKYPLANVKGAR